VALWREQRQAAAGPVSHAVGAGSRCIGKPGSTRTLDAPAPPLYTAVMPARHRNRPTAAARAPSLHPLERVVVVLADTDGPENLGSVARLCGNFGCALRLVRPNCAVDSRDALKMAHPCETSLQTAAQYPTVRAAVADLDLAVATSGKLRQAVAAEPLDVCRARLLMPAPPGRLGLLFGNERTGLGADDAALCPRLVRLPTPGEVDSLNLASAVAVALTLLCEAARGPVQARADEADRERLMAAMLRGARSRGGLDDDRLARLRPRLAELIDKMDVNAADIDVLAWLVG